MQPLPKKVTFIYVGVSSLAIFILALIFPHAPVVMIAGGALQAAVTAGLFALFVANFPYPAVYLAFLIVFTEPIMGIKSVEATVEQRAFVYYYGLETAVIVIGLLLAVFIDCKKNEPTAAP